MAAAPQSGGRKSRTEHVGGSVDMGTRTPQPLIVADSATAVDEAGYRQSACSVQDRPDFVSRQRVQPLDTIFVDHNLPLGDADRCLRPDGRSAGYQYG